MITYRNKKCKSALDIHVGRCLGYIPGPACPSRSGSCLAVIPNNEEDQWYVYLEDIHTFNGLGFGSVRVRLYSCAVRTADLPYSDPWRGMYRTDYTLLLSCIVLEILTLICQKFKTSRDLQPRSFEEQLVNSDVKVSGSRSQPVRKI